ncbi:hypothetical protein HG530_012106 [Fusarium avenaceum]|nr:hypothetical protein HG530_012106 [Fusarium avenaceum]
MGLDTLSGNGSLLSSLGLDELLHHVVQDEVVQRVTAKSAIPSSTKNLNLLNSLVELADILNCSALELHNSSLCGTGTHVKDDVVLRLRSVADVGELSSSSVVQTDSETIAENSQNLQTSKFSCGLDSPLLIDGVESWNCEDNGADNGSIASSHLCILLDAL